MDWSRIDGRLLVGECPVSSDDLAALELAGVDGLLSLQHDECLAALGLDWEALAAALAAAGVEARRVPMRDFDEADMRRRLPEAVRALHGLLSARRRVYVHCTQGVGRSPLVVAAYLSFVEGLDPVEAYERVRRARPRAVALWDPLMGCRTDLLLGARGELERRTAERCPAGAGAGTRALVREAVEAELLRERVLAASASA